MAGRWHADGMAHGRKQLHYIGVSLVVPVFLDCATGPACAHACRDLRVSAPFPANPSHSWNPPTHLPAQDAETARALLGAHVAGCPRCAELGPQGCYAARLGEHGAGRLHDVSREEAQHLIQVSPAAPRGSSSRPGARLPPAAATGHPQPWRATPTAARLPSQAALAARLGAVAAAGLPSPAASSAAASNAAACEAQHTSPSPSPSLSLVSPHSTTPQPAPLHQQQQQQPAALLPPPVPQPAPPPVPSSAQSNPGVGSKSSGSRVRCTCSCSSPGALNRPGAPR